MQTSTTFTFSSAPPDLKIKLPKQELQSFVKRWKVTEFALFGSVLRPDFRPDSDIDILISFAPDAGWTLFDLVAMQDELKGIFGRNVDLVKRKAVERSENYIRRNHILQNMKVVWCLEKKNVNSVMAHGVRLHAIRVPFDAPDSLL